MKHYWRIGLAIMIVSEAATLARIEPFWSWNTPIAWTGFILFADGLVWRARGNSWLQSSRREFTLLVLASIPLWLVFEGYNLIIKNWHYVGLPENWWLRQFGYAWSFATIWPAVFEGAELIAILRSGGRAGSDARDRGRTHATALAHPTYPTHQTYPTIAAGALMLACPFFVPLDIARYLAAPVWLGFIFLLDPLNAHLGGSSLFAELRQGRADRFINLALSGLLCGVLWEFWNYWSRAKWHYTVPIMEHVKIFEMPLPGYLGFPAFALECFTMYVFIRALSVRLVAGAGAGRPGRGIAL